MGSVLGEMSVVDDEDLVVFRDRCHPVGDRDRRTSMSDLLERVRDQALGSGVERRGCFVEEEHARIAQHCTRDRNALSLSTRQPAAALADHRVVPAGQGDDEVVQLRGTSRGFDLGVARARLPERDVLRDRRVEQKRLLEHDAELPAQRRDRRAS